MKKFTMCAFTFICASALFVFGLTALVGGNKAYAATPGTTPVLGNTMFKVSTGGDALMLATPILDYGDVYEVGYDITVSSGDVTYKNNKTDVFYDSIITKGKSWTSEDIFGATYADAGMIVWEIGYNSALTYTFRAYALVGERDAEELVPPSTEVKVQATENTLSDTYTLSFTNEKEVIAPMDVTYGSAIGELPAITAKSGYTGVWKIDDITITAETTWQAHSDKTATAVYTANNDTAYTVKFYANSPENESAFIEQTAKQLNLTGTTDTTAAFTDNVSTIFRGYDLDAGQSTTSGTIAGDGSLVLEVYCAVNLREVATYSAFATAVAEDNTYIILTSDLTYDKSVAPIFDTFSGVIDGKGYTIIDIKLGNSYSNTAWSLFTSFDGEMKDICFDVKYYGDFGGSFSAGSIACTFNGKAENILLKSLMVDYYYRNQYVSRVGIMFGQLGANAEIRDSIIQCVLYNSGYACPMGNGKPAGWIAASANAAATVENVHVIDIANKNLPWVGNNGISKSSTCVVGDVESVAEAAQSVFDGNLWYINGVAAPVMLNATNRATYVHTRVEVSTFAEMVAAIRADNNAYIALTNDITYDNALITGSNKDASGNAVISTNFSGVIDGQGHTFNSVALNASNGSDMRLFRFFTGDIKNIDIVATMHNANGQSSAAGVIALEFSGVAQNVKLTVTASQLYMANGYDTQQSGGLFGRLANGAYVKNILVDFTPAAGDVNVSGFGFVAGFVKENAVATVKNVVVINRGESVRPIIALLYKTSTVNGTAPAATTRYHSSEANANTMNSTIITNALVGDEATVISGASAILGSNWVCDGTNIPYLA